MDVFEVAGRRAFDQGGTPLEQALSRLGFLGFGHAATIVGHQLRQP